MNKKKIIIALVVVVLLIVAVFAVMTIRKVSILNSLITKGIETGKLTNYHIKNEQEFNGGINTEAWTKDKEHFLVKMKTKFNGGPLDIIMYRNGNEQLEADQIGEQKVVMKKTVFLVELNTFAQYMDSSSVWKNVNKTSIRSTQLENKDCYEIALGNDTTVWVEKETALVIKAQTARGVEKFAYEINTVTDADVQKPDLTGYTEN